VTESDLATRPDSAAAALVPDSRGCPFGVHFGGEDFNEHAAADEAARGAGRRDQREPARPAARAGRPGTPGGDPGRAVSRPAFPVVDALYQNADVN